MTSSVLDVLGLRSILGGSVAWIAKREVGAGAAAEGAGSGGAEVKVAGAARDKSPGSSS